MDQIVNYLLYTTLVGFAVCVLFNIRYVVSLPWKVQNGSRWSVVVWLILLIGMGQWFGRATQNVVSVSSMDTSASVQIASIVFAGIVMLFFMMTSFQLKNFRLPLLFLFIYGLEGVLTSSFSAHPELAAFKAFSVVIAVLWAVIAVKRLDDSQGPRLLFNVTYIYFLFLSVLALLGSILVPELTHYQNKGVFGFMLRGWPLLNPNSLSFLAAIVFVVSFRRLFGVKLFQRRLLYASASSVGLITLLLAQGRTSILSSILALLFLSLFVKEMRAFRYIFSLGVVVIMSVFLVTGTMGGWGEVTGEYLQRGLSEKQLSTLSGRTDAWKYSWELFLDSPIMGSGFYAAGKTLVAPHNAYFTVLLNGGLLGFIPWVIAIIGGMWLIGKHVFDHEWRVSSEENNFYKELVAVMIIQFARTITGQDLTIHSYSMLLFLSVLTYVIIRERNIGAGKKIDKKLPEFRSHHGKNKYLHHPQGNQKSSILFGSNRNE